MRSHLFVFVVLFPIVWISWPAISNAWHKKLWLHVAGIVIVGYVVLLVVSHYALGMGHGRH